MHSGLGVNWDLGSDADKLTFNLTLTVTLVVTVALPGASLNPDPSVEEGE